jgi:hypothetical protein
MAVLALSDLKTRDESIGCPKFGEHASCGGGEAPPGLPIAGSYNFENWGLSSPGTKDGG